MTIGIEASHANIKNRTGVEEYSWQLIKHLKKIIPAEVRVILYSPSPLLPELSELPPNWESRVLRWRFGKMWSQFRLSWELFFHKPDIFFAPGQLLPCICPRNTVATIHDSAFLVYPKAYHFFGRQYLKWMNRRILRKSKIILTPSEFSRQELKRLYKYPIEKVKVTPLGLNSNYQLNAVLSEDEKNVLLNKYKISRRFFISVGRLEEKKNTANIVKSFELIRHKHDCQLVLVGHPGCGYNAVHNAIENSKYRSDIILLGWLPSEDIVKLYSLAVCLVFPSKYEGFGLPVLEAMSVGCPVVASEGNSLEEVGGEACLYADPDDIHGIAALAENLLTNHFLWQDLAAKGQSRAKNFSWENTANLTWQALSVLGK